MKSLSALGLLACAALLGAPGEAVAQSSGVSRTRHLPPVTWVALRGSQASYTTAAPRSEAYSSMFTRSALVNEPTPAAASTFCRRSPAGLGDSSSACFEIDGVACGSFICDSVTCLGGSLH